MRLASQHGDRVSRSVVLDMPDWRWRPELIPALSIGEYYFLGLDSACPRFVSALRIHHHEAPLQRGCEAFALGCTRNWRCMMAPGALPRLRCQALPCLDGGRCCISGLRCGTDPAIAQVPLSAFACCCTTYVKTCGFTRRCLISSLCASACAFTITKPRLEVALLSDLDLNFCYQPRSVGFVMPFFRRQLPHNPDGLPSSPWASCQQRGTNRALPCAYYA